MKHAYPNLNGDVPILRHLLSAPHIESKNWKSSELAKNPDFIVFGISDMGLKSESPKTT